MPTHDDATAELDDLRQIQAQARDCARRLRGLCDHCRCRYRPGDPAWRALLRAYLAAREFAVRVGALEAEDGDVPLGWDGRREPPPT